MDASCGIVPRPATGDAMAHIRTIQEDEAEGRLAELYAVLQGKGGRVDNILKIHSLNVPSLEAHVALYRTIMFGRSSLSRRQREMIAVTVSVLNHCHY